MKYGEPIVVGTHRPALQRKLQKCAKSLFSIDLKINMIRGPMGAYPRYGYFVLYVMNLFAKFGELAY